MLLGLFVLTEIVVLCGLVVMMGGSVVMRSGLMMVLAGLMRRFCHGHSSMNLVLPPCDGVARRADAAIRQTTLVREERSMSARIFVESLGERTTGDGRHFSDAKVRVKSHDGSFDLLIGVPYSPDEFEVLSWVQNRLQLLLQSVLDELRSSRLRLG